MLRIFIALTVCAFALMSGGASRAAVISYQGAATDIFYNGSESAFAWQQFDSTLGVLNAVTYSVSGQFTFSVSQTAPFDVIPTYSVSKGLTLNGTGLAQRNPSHGDFDAVINLSRTPGDPLTPGETEIQTVLVDFLRTPDLGLADFIGAGMINANLGVSEDSDLCYSDDLAAGGYHVDCSQTGNLTVAVTYDYTPGHAAASQETSVPEPAAALLVGFGLAATAFASMQKSKAALQRL